MSKTAHIEILLKNTKRFTLLLAITSTFTAMVYVIGGALMLMYMQDVYIPMEALIFTLVLGIVNVVFCIVMYKLNSKLKKGQVVSRTPYLIFLAFQVIIVIAEFATGSMTADRMFMVAALILLPVLAISNLRKVEHIQKA